MQKRPVKATPRNAAVAAAIIATPLIALAGFALLRDNAHTVAEADLANEVAVQCAEKVSGYFDALAEGDAGTGVPSPDFDALTAECATVLDGGANYAQATTQVIAGYES